MSSMYKTCISILCGVATISSAFGQSSIDAPLPPANVTQPDDSLCLSLKNALIISSKQDPAVAIARAQETQADADVTTARSLFRPQISGFGRTGLGNTGLTDSVLQNQIGVRASQRIFDFGDAKFARRAARSSLLASKYDIRQVQLLSALNTGLAYLEAAQAQEQMKVTEQRLGFFAQQLKSIDILLEQGAATRTERANVASRLANTQAAGLEVKFALDSALTQVETDTGLLPNICPDSDHGELLSSLTASIPDRESAVTIALAKNPNIESLKNRAKSLEAERRREKTGRFPIVNIVGVSAFSSAGSLDTLDQQNRVGLDVSVPIYSGNAQSAANQRAGALKVEADGRLRELERQLSEEVTIAFQRIASLRNQAVSRAEVAKQTRLRFEAAEIEYNAGTRTLAEFIEVRLEFEQAAIDTINIRYDLLRQQIQFLTLTAQLPIIFDNISLDD